MVMLSPLDSTTWTRVGKSSLGFSALVILGIGIVGALFIASPMAQLLTLVLGSPQPFLLGYLGGIVVFVVLIAPVILPRATRALQVDPSRTRMRSGFQVADVSQIRHAYRIPDGLFDDRFQLRLAVGGLDPLISISPTPRGELSVQQLDALIALISAAPIEPDPAMLMRPPLAGELGVRDDAQVFDDDLAFELLPFETMSFAKPTLLAELQRTRDTVAHAGVPQGGSSALRDLGLVAPGTTNAPRSQARLALAQSQAGLKRGFWVMLGTLYRDRLRGAEAALGVVGASHRDGRWWAGLLLIVLGFASPWLSAAAAFLMVIAPVPGIGLGDSFAPVAFFVLSWPFIVWPGFVVMWRSRIARFERARSAALVVRRGRRPIPEEVAQFFGPAFPEVSFVGPLLWLLLFESVILLAGGLTAVVMAGGGVENWSGVALALPVGIVMVAASAPVFAWAVRVIRDAPVRQLRAVALWKAIASSPGERGNIS